MAYDPTIWSDEVPSESPVKFLVKDSQGNIIHDAVTIELITPVTPGTPLHAAHLNKIEQGIAEAHASITARQVAARMDNKTWVDTATQTPAIIPFHYGTIDTDARLTVGANARFTANRGGVYEVSFWASVIDEEPAQFPSTTQVDIYKNGSYLSNLTYLHFLAQASGVSNSGILSGTELVQLNAGDFIQFYASRSAVSGAYRSELYDARVMINLVWGEISI